MTTQPGRPSDLDQQLAALYERYGSPEDGGTRGQRLRLRSLLDEAMYGPVNPNAPGLVIFRDGTAEVERDGRLVQLRRRPPDQKRSA
ncbi:hypothetical protein ACWC5I_00105 [Kitasatospora sp. NPDC001574]